MHISRGRLAHEPRWRSSEVRPWNEATFTLPGLLFTHAKKTSFFRRVRDGPFAKDPRPAQMDASHKENITRHHEWHNSSYGVL